MIRFETRVKNLANEILIAKAEQLERDADTLYLSLLAPSMAERAMREEAKELREVAK